ncbi:MAG: DUF1499 domain-containing protein [Panacagrimonas sp.]
MKTLFKLVLIAAIAVVGLGVYKTLTPPGDLYVSTRVFAACPPRPSCVSSVATDDQHRVAALGYTADPSTAFSMLREVVERMGGQIQDEATDYLHAVFVSPKMRYRDDLEMLVLPGGKIEVRSASRFGYEDFGVNRDRVEDLRRAFEAMPAP